MLQYSGDTQSQKKSVQLLPPVSRQLKKGSRQEAQAGSSSAHSLNRLMSSPASCAQVSQAGVLPQEELETKAAQNSSAQQFWASAVQFWRDSQLEMALSRVVQAADASSVQAWRQPGLPPHWRRQTTSGSQALVAV